MEWSNKTKLFRALQNKKYGRCGYQIFTIKKYRSNISGFTDLNSMYSENLYKLI